MVNYNLAKLIIMKYDSINKNVSPEEKQIVTYFLKKDLIELLGANTLSSKDCDILTKPSREFIEIEIDSIYSKLLHIKIGNVDNSNVICAYIDDDVVFSIKSSDGVITNEVAYTDINVVNVREDSSVVLEDSSKIDGEPNIDAVEFSSARYEDGEEVYEGSLSPVLARAGAVEYFEFKTNTQKKANDKSSFLEKIIDNITSNSMVSVATCNDTHKIIDYTDAIFEALDEKLEKEKVKKDIKKRKLAKTKKNDE